MGLIVTGLAIGALIPIFLVVYPAAGLGPSAARDPAAFLPVVARNPALFVVPGVLEVAGHVIGAIAMLAIWFRWGRSSFLLTCSTVAGVAWMGIDTIDNTISLQLVPTLASAFAGGDAAAAGAFADAGRLTDALRLAGHLGGGLWVIGAARFALDARLVHPVVGWLGIAAGIVLALNPFVPPLLNVSFMTLPAWLILFGVAIGRNGASVTAPQPAYGGA
jgi:hypothetical protein